MTWLLVFIEYLDRLRTDEVSALMSERGTQETDLKGEQFRLPRIKADSSFGIGKLYHETMRRLDRKVVLTHPPMKPQCVLKNEVKAINVTRGENSIVPSKWGIRTFLLTPYFRVPSSTTKRAIISVSGSAGRYESHYRIAPNI